MCDGQVEARTDAHTAGVLDWTGVRTQRAEYGPAAMIFAQGSPATSVMYLEKGVVRLSVLSHAGKEAVVALLLADLAAHMLRSGREAIVRVAERSGYESEAAFNRAFKREFGMPPAGWRRAAAQ